MQGLRKYLQQGGESAERFELILSLTDIRSEAIIDALRDHLVNGWAAVTARTLNGVDKGNFSNALKAMNKKAAIVERVKELDAAK